MVLSHKQVLGFAQRPHPLANDHYGFPIFMIA
jgi:hypothetical protein